MRARLLQVVCVLVLASADPSVSCAADAPLGAAVPGSGTSLPIQGVVPEADVKQLPEMAEPSAKATPRPLVRVENALGLGRLILPGLAHAAYSFSVDGGRITVTTAKTVRFADPRRRLRNAVSTVWAPGTVQVVASPGAAVRVRPNGRGLVIELRDPPPARIDAASPPAGPEQGVPAPAAGPVSAGPPPPPAAAPSPSTAAAGNSQGPAGKPTSGAVSVGGSEVVGLRPLPRQAASPPRIEPVPGVSDPAILVPAGREVGLAAFRSGSDTVFVLDSPFDIAVPRTGIDRAFAGMSSARTQDATVLRVPGGDTPFRMSRGARGWIISAGAALVPPDPILSRVARDPGTPPSMRFLLSEPSRAVRVMDPSTGALLLVGTQLVPGQFVARPRSQVQFIVLPTLQGVVIDPGSDDLQMRREVDGFDLLGGPGTPAGIISSVSADQPPGVAPPPAMSRAFSIPVDTVAGLYAALNRRIAEAGIAPSLARAPARVAVAEAMIGLGMGVEAQSVLDVAAADDPSYAGQPDFVALRGASALLARRMDQADPLLDRRADGSEEIEMWRSLARVAQDEVSEPDARVLARALPLLLSYPLPLRDRLLPDALEAIALGGQPDAAAAALKGLDDPRLDVARGIVAELSGHIEDAAARYDALAAGSDRLPRYKALLRGVEMRLRAGLTDAKSAADALDRSLYAWRGERQELALRIRIADLRRRAGQWREAFAVLRDGRDIFPDDRGVLDREIAATLLAFVSGGDAGRMQPADLVALYDREQDLIQGLAWDEPLGIRFAERLASLGLQGRAEPIMAGLASRAADDGRRAFLGARLASLRMTMDDPSGAIAALADTAPPSGIPVDASLSAARQLLYARAESERGDKDRALSMLASLDSEAADEVRADIHSSRRDWPHAVEALSALERRRGLGPVPDADGRALVSRLAVAAALASDRAALDRLAAVYGPAMAAEPAGAVFRLMTERPVSATADLGRASGEMRDARDVRDAVAAPLRPAAAP